MQGRGIVQEELSPREQQVFAAGYTEAMQDHAGDTATIAAQAAEIRRLERALATAQNDLERIKRTAAALEEEAAGYFEQLRQAGAFDDELAQRKAVYRARRAEVETEQKKAADTGYQGGPVEW